ncbi:hypothetical protein [Glycomyces arizonensis]|uniref:hypothetical protein n=1 Tax=Glycomyces arizonensis TaxID=256035 RepID=UPI0012ECB946|nr:hypothetical protein [Glycomyces arizonensis]
MNMANHLAELRLAIGDATPESAKAELLLEGLLVGLVESHDARVLGKPGPMGPLIQRCKGLLQKREDLDPQRAEALALLDKVDTLRNKRNRLIHDVVAVQPIQAGKREGPQFARLASPWRSSIQSDPFEVSELWELSEEFRQISMKLFLWSYENLPYLGKQWTSN